MSPVTWLYHNGGNKLEPVAEIADDALEPKARARLAGAYVYGQLGQTLDGRIACPNGVSRYINGSAALDHLHALRAEVDAVLVGVGTVIADDPALTVRRCSGRTPRAVVVDPRRRTPPHAQIFSVGTSPPLFIRSEHDAGGPDEIGVAALPNAGGGHRLDPVAIVAALATLGYKRILIEGGASTLSHFINHRAIDRLHILMAPIILGSGVTGISLDPVESPDAALRPEIHLTRFADGDVLYDCRLKSAWST
jgi:riboflavin-specific deaminase-like protein